MFNGFSVSVLIFYFLNGFVQLYLARSLYKRFPEHNIKTSYFTVGLWFFAGLAYPFLMEFAKDAIPDELMWSMLIIMVVTPLLVAGILFYQWIVLKREPELREKRQPRNLKREIQTKGDEGDMYSAMVDLKRKLLHLVPASLILILWVFGTSAFSENYAYFLIITVGYSGIFIFAMLDLVRFSWLFGTTKFYELLPNNVLHLMTKAMKPKELVEFIKSVPLVLAMIPSLFFHPSVFIATSLIATIGDGCASIFGKAFGKRNWPAGSPKTVIGYIAGGLGTFTLTLLSTLIFSEFFVWKCFTLALISGIAFALIDIRSFKVDDNILNSLIIGPLLGVFALIF